jgi:AsmA protein
MKRGLKILGIIIAIPIVLFVIAAIMLVTLDLNEYREPIAKSISDATGRELKLTGDLQKSFFPWLGVKIGGVELSNAQGFKEQAFARLQNAEVRIDTLSLLRMQPSIDKVVVHGLQVNLARDKQGKTNWDDLLQKEPTAAEAIPEQAPAPEDQVPARKPSEALQGVKVGGLEIRNAQLSWDDAHANASYQVQNLNVTLSEIELGKPLSLDMSTRVVSVTPKIQADIKLMADKIHWDLDQQHFKLEPLQLAVRAEGDMLPGNKTNVDFSSPLDLDLQNQTFSVSAIALEVLGIRVQGQFSMKQITSEPVFEGNIKVASLSPKEMFKTLGIDAPPTADPKVLEKASIELGLTGNAKQATIKPLHVVLDDTTLNGLLGVTNFADPAINFRVEVDAIDLDRYLPPPAETPATQSTPAPAPKTTRDTGDEPLPVEPLRALNMKGQLNVGALTASKIIINDLVVTMDANKGLLHLKPVSGKVSGGRFTTDITLDATSDQLKVAVKEKVADVQVAPILKAVIDNDPVSGAVKLNADINTVGKTTNQLMAALQGAVDFQFNNGALKGFNLADYARQGKALIKGQSYTPSDELKQTDFTELTGKAVIQNGVVDNTELKGKSPIFRIEGQGKVDLVKQSIDYLLTSYVVGTSKGQGGAELGDLKGLPIPVRIKGSYTQLEYDFDEKAFRKAVADQFKDQLKAKEQELKQELEARKQEEIEKQKQKLKEELKEEEDKLKKKLEEKLKKLF